ncbi:MAG: TIM barrel protein [Thermomicrobiales bacterium]
MTGPKASFTWWSFKDRSVTDHELLRGAASLGYDGVELADEALWPEITDAGLSLATLRGHEPLELGLNRLDHHDRLEREILANLELAQCWHIPILICFSGNRDGLSEAEGRANTVTGLARVARAAEEAQVTLALELLNSRVDHPDYQCDRTSWGMQVIDQVNSPRVKLLYDVYHMQIMEGDIIRTIDAHHDAFAHYHVAGNPGRHEPDDTQELNLPPIYRAIAATGYSGFVGQEFIPASGDPLASLGTALAAFRAAVSD